MVNRVKKCKFKIRTINRHVIKLLIVEKSMRGGICHAGHWYVKVNNNYIKHHNRNKGFPYVMYWDLNDYGWAMSQKLSLGGFECTESISQFNEDFIKCCKEDSNIGYFLEAHV